jgi:glycosyltransferase involved in cell wall biosynthesis
MRVCQVLAGDEDGGLEKHTIELSKALRAKGMDVTVVAHKKFKDDFGNINFIEADLTQGRHNLFILWKLYNILKSGNFDIIHAQANKATAMVVRLKPFLSSKIVATLHGYKRDLKAFKKADFVITVSDRIGGKLDINNKRTVYNGIKIEDIDSIDLHQMFSIPRDQFILCGVGRLVEAKGFDLLVESMQYADQDICLLLIGDGQEKEKLENLSKKLNIKNRIIFAGNIENRLTERIIKSSDLLAISSRREGFSYVFAESLLLDTPIISTDVADIKKFITEKYISPFDPKALAGKINDFRANYSQEIFAYQEIFNNAKHIFTIENMVIQTMKIYQEALR